MEPPTGAYTPDIERDRAAQRVLDHGQPRFLEQRQALGFVQKARGADAHRLRRLGGGTAHERSVIGELCEGVDRFAFPFERGDAEPLEGRAHRILRRGDCDGLLAFVDLPNANVGFEVGYGLGLHRAVALTCVRPGIPDWLSGPPLNGLLCPRMETPEEIRAAIRSAKEWIRLPSGPTPGSEVLLLCPARTGAVYSEQVPEDGVGGRCRRADGTCTSCRNCSPASAWSSG